MRTEKWLVLCIVMALIQLVACERGKMEGNAPEPLSARTNVDSIQNDSLITDSLGTDTLVTNPVDSSGIDSSAYRSRKDILDDDIVRITPIVLPDSAQNLLIFQCVTEKKYDCDFNLLTARPTKTGNTYSVVFDEVLQGAACWPGNQSTGRGNASFNDVPANFEGVLEIKLGHQVYTGSIKRTGVSHYEFTWTDESRIVFTKKSI